MNTWDSIRSVYKYKILLTFLLVVFCASWIFYLISFYATDINPNTPNTDPTRYHDNIAGGTSYSYRQKTQYKNGTDNSLKALIANIGCNMTSKGDIFCLHLSSSNYNINSTSMYRYVSTSDTLVTTIAFYENIKFEIVANHANYARQHNYDYFVLRHKLKDKHLDLNSNSKRMYTYTDKDTGINISNVSKPDTMSFIGSQQRVTLLYRLFFDNNFIIQDLDFLVSKSKLKLSKNYQRILWIDFDAIFLNDSISIDNIINYSINKYSYYNYKMKNNLSLIMTGDWSYKINTGVMILLKTNFTKFLLQTWHKLMKLGHTKNQIALGILLFGGNENLNILKRLSNCSDSNRQLAFELTSKLVENLNRMKQFNSSFHNNIFAENFGAVTQFQATYSHNVLLSQQFGNNIAFVKQGLMNSNIWNQFNNIDNVLKQWIMHFAGQGAVVRFQMISIFLHYKQDYRYYIDYLQLNNPPTRNLMKQQDKILKKYVQNNCFSLKKKADMFAYALQRRVSFEKAMEILDKRNYAKYNITI